MADYDVIIIGGGMSGLTCAAYLGKAGLNVLLIEGKGECGAHCDTLELGIPGFMHNTHAAWMLTAPNPAIADLELPRHGLEFLTSEVACGHTNRDGTNILYGNAFSESADSWERHSKSDGQFMRTAAAYFEPRMAPTMDAVGNFLFQAPSVQNLGALAELLAGFYEKTLPGVNINDMIKMNGFELADILFESEQAKSMITYLCTLFGFSAHHKMLGALGVALMAPLVGTVIPIHLVKGGSHTLIHALVKEAKQDGVKILSSCPVHKILVENGAVAGVELSPHAIFPGERLTAEKVVSNLSLVPTFLELIGPEVIGPESAFGISQFSYEEQVVFAINYALSGDPQFSSSHYDDGIQRTWTGFFGADTQNEVEKYCMDYSSGRVGDNIALTWLTPSRIDPTQVPPGQHSSIVWYELAPSPSRYGKKRINGFSSWDSIKESLADKVTDLYEFYAPGFKELIRERHVITPLDIYRANPSAILGNWSGGSHIPTQFYFNRPLPGICSGGASRTFLPNLYLSNSIHPYGASWMASGYIAACEVAEDFGAREQSWWCSKPWEWLRENPAKIVKG